MVGDTLRKLRFRPQLRSVADRSLRILEGRQDLNL